MDSRELEVVERGWRRVEQYSARPHVMQKGDGFLTLLFGLVDNQESQRLVGHPRPRIRGLQRGSQIDVFGSLRGEEKLDGRQGLSGVHHGCFYRGRQS